jgi:DNA-binding response OmpR family regulator
VLPEYTKFLKVLYVEDDEIERDNLSQTLHLIFNDVYSCKNGSEALEVYKNNHIDLLIADYLMPTMSGAELIAAIREQNRELPAIIISGHTTYEHLIDCIPLKLVAYIQKPFNFDTIISAIAKAVEEIDNVGKMNAVICDGVYYQPFQKNVITDGKTVDLTKIESDLIELMLKHKTQVVSKEQICETVFDSIDGVSDNVIKNAIYRLRKRVGKPIIKNIKNVGYILE